MQARRREMIEVPLAAIAEPRDPFDPRVVAVDAHVTCPSGRVLTQPCFWGQPHSRHLDGARERWEPSGPRGVRLRLAPPEVGRHDVEIVTTDADGARVVQRFALDVEPSGAPGPARISRDAPHRLVREDGSAFVPIGTNLCWWLGRDPSVQMERALGRMAAAGQTWARLWLTHFGDGFTIEWDRAHPSGHYEGLGRYSLTVAARLDAIFAEATRLGIGVQLVLWQHSQLSSPQHSAWGDNPYNATRGGPCTCSAEFFSSPEAIDLSDRRLRYVVARWGASPALFAWEVFNEMDLVVDAPLDVVARWCADRARTIRALDAHEHLVTTSQAFPPSLVPPVASVDPTWDLGQVHVYAEDLVDAIAREGAAVARWGKPTLLAEAGLGPDGALERAHPDGKYLHDATWAALAVGFEGGAMAWWWDSAVDARDFWDRQEGAARFVRSGGASALGSDLGPPREDLQAEGSSGARVVGRAGAGGAIAWIRAASDAPVPGAQLALPGLPAGEWCVQQWDTRTGRVTRDETLRIGPAGRVPVGPFVRDTLVVVCTPHPRQA